MSFKYLAAQPVKKHHYYVFVVLREKLIHFGESCVVSIYAEVP